MWPKLKDNIVQRNCFPSLLGRTSFSEEMTVVSVKSAPWLEWLVWQRNHLCQFLLLRLLLLRIQKCQLQRPPPLEYTI